MKYFTISELSRSSTALKYSIDNTPGDTIVSNLVALVDNLLDPIREAWGKAVIVSSGYRCPALNKKVGGSPTSDHMLGKAADITTGNKVDNKKLFDLISSLNLPFDLMIDEKSYKWIHISYRSANNRNLILHLK